MSSDKLITDDEALVRIPAIVGKKPATLDTDIYSPHGVCASYPNKIIGWRVVYPGADLKRIINLRVKVAELSGSTDKTFLYRGYEHADFLVNSMVAGPSIIPSIRADFGHAQYYTDCVEYALLYAPQGGVITIHDWTETDNLSIRHLADNEWKQYVKFHIARTNILLPERITAPRAYREDFLSGMVSKNFEEIYTCAAPIESPVTQVAAKTQAACGEMASRLIAIIYMF